MDFSGGCKKPKGISLSRLGDSGNGGMRNSPFAFKDGFGGFSFSMVLSMQLAKAVACVSLTNESSIIVGKVRLAFGINSTNVKRLCGSPTESAPGENKVALVEV